MSRSAKRWAGRHVIDELRELRVVGYAWNVQTWAAIGVKSNVEQCKLRRREAERLLRIAINAVNKAAVR